MICPFLYSLLDHVLDTENCDVNLSIQDPQKNIYGLAKIGTRTALNFAFAFLRRAWRSGSWRSSILYYHLMTSMHKPLSHWMRITGEDSDICTELLQETFESLQSLPEALLFDESKVSPVWIDILEKSSSFLRQVVLGYEESNIQFSFPYLWCIANVF